MMLVLTKTTYMVKTDADVPDDVLNRLCDAISDDDAILGLEGIFTSRIEAIGKTFGIQLDTSVEEE